MNRKAVIFLATVLALAIAGPAGAQLPGHFGATRAPAIAIDKSNDLYVTMSVATKPPSAGTPGSQTFFTISKDGGRTWNNLPFTRNLSKSRGEAYGPAIAVTKAGTTRAYIVYHDDSGGNTQAYLVRSKKKAKFRSPKNITPGDGGAFYPRVALDSSEAVNVVWGDTAGGGRRVVFIRSTDQGASFGDAVDISRSSGAAFDPEIAVDSADTINIVWDDITEGVSSIMFCRSTDGGQTFSEPLRVSSAEGSATEAHIAIDGSNRIHVVWVDESDEDAQILYARSTDGGQSFSASTDVSDDEGEEFSKPYVAVFEDSVYIVYQKDSGRSRQVLLVTSSDAGLSFSDSEQVSQADPNRGRAHSPAMAVDSEGRLHILWIDTTEVGNDEGLLYYSNTRNGTTFAPQRVLIAGLP
ncbi:MAG: sialidase family protein [Acidobacteriota bacterium]